MKDLKQDNVKRKIILCEMSKAARTGVEISKY